MDPAVPDDDSDEAGWLHPCSDSWFPDKHAALQTSQNQRRYLIRIATWGEPAHVFEEIVPYLQETSGPFWTQNSPQLKSVDVHWGRENQRIIAEFRVERTGDGLDPETEAENPACYWDRSTEAEIGDWISGRSAIIGVLPLDDAAESAG